MTCPERCRSPGRPYDDVVPFGPPLVERFPDRVIWGTDWPHPNQKGLRRRRAVDFIPKIAPTAAQDGRSLVGKSMRLCWSA